MALELLIECDLEDFDAFESVAEIIVLSDPEPSYSSSSSSSSKSGVRVGLSVYKILFSVNKMRKSKRKTM